MKFTQLPKKLLLSGMSAAMVVAFAPAVASAAVNETDPTSQAASTGVSGDTVATLTWTENSRVYTQEFKSTNGKTNDDAVQAALVKAAQKGTKAAPAKVTLNKSVSVDTVTGTDQIDGEDPVNQTYMMPNSSDGGLLVGGYTTIDLNGNTLSEAKEGKSSVVTLTKTKNLQGDVKESQSKTVLAENVNDAKAGTNIYKTTAKGNAKQAESLPSDASDVTAARSGSSYYVWNATIGDWDTYSDKDKADAAATNASETVYLAFKVGYKTAANASIPAAESVSIVNGTVTSDKGNRAISGYSGELTLGKGAVVTTEGAAAAVKSNGTVNLQEGADVEATNRGAVGAIYAKDVNIKAVDESASKYDSVATVKASTTASQDSGIVTYGIKASGKVTANATADVTVTSNALDTGDSASGYNGEIGGTGYVPRSVAVSASVVALNYGNYTGDWAVRSDAGSIKYGTYTGYVDGGLTVTGGKFSYKPDKNFGTRNNDTAYQAKNKLGEDEYSNTYKTAQNNGYWYVYRLGQVQPTYTKDGSANSAWVTLGVPSDQKDSDGNAYNGISDYLQDKFLNDYTKTLVFTEQGYGLKVNDGNTDDRAQANVNLYVDAGYLTPTERNAKAKGFETAYSELAAQATANKQTAQGVYDIAAQTKYGKLANRAKSEKVEDVATLTNAPVDVYATKVQTNSDAKAYKLGETNTEYTVSRPAAIGDDLNGTAAFQTADAGYYGITVTTNSDASKQGQEAADAAKDAADQASKAVQELTEALNKATDQITTDSATIASLQEQLKTAQAALETAQKAATDAANAAQTAQNTANTATTTATDLQKQLDQTKSDLEKAQQELANEQAVAKAKAQKVKSLKVTVGKKKATVKWSKVSGYKYQVKYRQKNSSTTSDFKTVKTSKTKYTAKKLKTGKYYNFKVRTYKKVNGKTVYGKWTSIVTGKIK